MDKQPYQDLLRLTEAERKKLLDRLDNAAHGDLSSSSASAAPKNKTGQDKRRDKRWGFRSSPIGLIVEHPGGGISRYSVSGRNLSAGGMSFLHGGYLNKGSKCRLSLLRLDGRAVALTGMVMSCRLIDGRVHEVGLKFDRAIEPTAFLKFEPGSEGGAGETMDLPNLHGRVLFVEDTEVDQRLVQHHLKSTGIHLIAARTPAEALEAVKSESLDIVLCDLNLGNFDGIEVIRGLRTAGFAGPIVLVTADSDTNRMAEAKAAGADHTLNKPYDPAALLGLLVRLHQQVGAVVQADQVSSSLGDQPGLEEMILTFIEQARTASRKIEAAGKADDFKQVRELCMMLKGSAPSYGYKALGDAAHEAMQSLDATMSVQESARLVKRLCLMCQQLMVRPPAREENAPAH